MDNYILLVACFVVGMLLRRSGRLPDNAHAALNGFIIHVSLPALTLLYVHHLRADSTLLFPIAMAWVMFGAGFLFFRLIGRLTGLPAVTVGALTLTGSLANTSFIGLPMIETFYGTQGLALGILIDQMGTYLVLSTVGIFVAAMYGQRGHMTAKAIVRKVLTFAPFLALVLAVLLIPVTYPKWLETLLGRLGGTLVPLALVSVGYQVQWSAIRGKATELGLGLAFKLVIAPMLIMLLFAALFGARGEVVQITIFEAAMAPQIGAAIVAVEHDLDPPLVTLMVGIGIPLSFVTLPVWYHVLTALG
ncbi:MAG TPA: AEC family transporter [Casimicrobiaceae bacterium]|nr:AEC family transporter [Casimicrobiaceae bacterium]